MISMPAASHHVPVLLRSDRQLRASIIYSTPSASPASPLLPDRLVCRAWRPYAYRYLDLNPSPCRLEGQHTGAVLSTPLGAAVAHLLGALRTVTAARSSARCLRAQHLAAFDIQSLSIVVILLVKDCYIEITGPLRCVLLATHAYERCEADVRAEKGT